MSAGVKSWRPANELLDYYLQLKMLGPSWAIYGANKVTTPHYVANTFNFAMHYK